jgi:hypothetical protein
MHMILAFGIAFQMPVLLTLLCRSASCVETLRKGRRYAIVGMFVVAAIITPPDIISQIGLALPLILLYEISILAAALDGAEARELTHDGRQDPAAMLPSRAGAWPCMTSVAVTPRLRRGAGAARMPPSGRGAACSMTGCASRRRHRLRRRRRSATLSARSARP